VDVALMITGNLLDGKRLVPALTLQAHNVWMGFKGNNIAS
jgi:hypothetical protein